MTTAGRVIQFFADYLSPSLSQPFCICSAALPLSATDLRSLELLSGRGLINSYISWHSCFDRTRWIVFQVIIKQLIEHGSRFSFSFRHCLLPRWDLGFFVWLKRNVLLVYILEPHLGASQNRLNLAVNNMEIVRIDVSNLLKSGSFLKFLNLSLLLVWVLFFPVPIQVLVVDIGFFISPGHLLFYNI